MYKTLTTYYCGTVQQDVTICVDIGLQYLVSEFILIFFLLSYKRSIKLSVVPQLKDKDLFIYAVNLLNLIL